LSGARTTKAAWALIAVACLSVASCGEPSWSKVNPSFTPETAPRAVFWHEVGPHLQSIWRSGPELWAVGWEGTILHTTDGGRKWEAQTSPTDRSLSSVTGSGRDLWAVGQGGTILHTNNGGRKWEPQTSPTDRYLLSITGDGVELWAVGDEGTILHTNDGGNKWERQTCPTTKHLQSVTRSGRELWAVGQGGTILHTTDGGREWKLHASPTDRYLTSVTGKGPDLWAVGGHGATILHSTDGGTRWKPQSSPTDKGLLSVTGGGPELWAVGDRGTILHATDGGRRWKPQNSPTDKDLLSITGDRRELWVVGQGGTILHTTDGGKKWDTQNRPASNYLFSVAGDGRELWAVGQGGTILHTKDGGTEWKPQISPTENDLHSVTGSGRHLWAVGEGGTILRTNDGGTEWKPQLSPTDNELNSVIGNGRDLWAVGWGGTIVHTADGGMEWQLQTSPAHNDLFSVTGSGPELWAVGDRGAILHTNDGGRTWKHQTSSTDRNLYSVSGSGPELWAVGQGGTILHTNDSGRKWERQTSSADKDLHSVTGSGPELWAVGNVGTVLRTADGGKNWNPQTAGTDADVIKAIYTGPNFWAVEGNGAELRGVADGQYPYVKEARIRRGIFTARLEFHVTYPAEAEDSTTRLSLRGLNASLFEQGQPMQTDFTNHPIKAEAASDIWAFDFSPDAIFVQPGDRAHFQVELWTGGEQVKILHTTDGGSGRKPQTNPADRVVSSVTGGGTKVTSNDFAVSYDVTLTYDPWAWFRENGALLLGASLAFLILVMFTACLFTKPLWNLKLYRALKIYNVIAQIEMPGVGPVLREVLKVTALPWFVQHRRTLDAWVQAHIALLPERWQLDSQDAMPQGLGPGSVQTRPSYVPLPVRLQSAAAADLKQAPTAEWASGLFNSRRTIIEIAGPGGAGKTTLAREFAQWAIDGGRPDGLKLHAMLPVWVDEEIDEKNALLAVVKRKLTAWFPEEEIETELIQALLKKQRILVIVDRLSERSAATQQYVSSVHGGLKVNALIVTTRQEVKFEAGAPLILYPQALDSKSLLHFMTSILAEYAQQSTSGVPHAFDTIERQLDLGHRLAALIQVRGAQDDEIPILPLTVRVFVDEAVRLIREGRPLDELPRSLPEAYFRSLEKVNPKTPGAKNAMTDEAMLRAAKLLGKLATGSDFIPKEFSMQSARESLRAAGWTDPEKLDPVQRLIDNGVLVEKKRGGFHVLRFELDPIAEFLSAAAWAEQCGSRISDWQDLKKRSASAPGFQIALRLTLADMNLGIEWDKI
jgi:photosystem II stability/assembly factor-like uncharacterized protein